ncbi:hypothetical protein [Candidatus Nitrosocosmicus sp. SS]|uniref:hypothetical protein n=1 Tax=Candidatus Nitrosocosmicus agrestis TaxID=2563600 RepID=UPI0013313269|nr:hypothetical protein [Candidatus Nitrosocosmicus sp. SS]KAF0870135.1 hypothetical protein E5N71_00990 [Candidatus Nitrosocosmicus sp. SS]
MYFNKVTSGIVSAIFLLLILSSVNVSSIKLANAAEGDLVNYNNNFDIYTSPNDPNKDSAMQNADCVVNFMQTYIYASSSAQNCNSPSSTPQQQQSQPPVDQNQIQGQPQYQRQYQPQQATGQGLQATDGPQTGTSAQSDEVGVVKVVNGNKGSGTNSVSSSFAPVQSTSFAVPQQDNDKNAKDNDNDDNDNNDNDKNAKDNDNDDNDNNDNDKNAKDNDNDDNDNNDNDKNAKDNDNDDNDNDNKDGNKIYNEKSVSKDERKLLLTTCFERGYDKGNYLSTEEIVKCAENYNA